MSSNSSHLYTSQVQEVMQLIELNVHHKMMFEMQIFSTLASELGTEWRAHILGRYMLREYFNTRWDLLQNIQSLYFRCSLCIHEYEPHEVVYKEAKKLMESIQAQWYKDKKIADPRQNLTDIFVREFGELEMEKKVMISQEKGNDSKGPFEL